MIRTLTYLLLFFSYSFIFAQNELFNLELDSNYPLWLTTSECRTDQTSGIAFIKSESCKKYFLVADDIGSIHSLEISSDESIIIKPIIYSDSAKQFLSTLPKADFEEIVFDRSANSVYLSIEGNRNNYRDYVGIFKIHFATDKFPFKEISYFEKLEFKPRETFLKYTDKNIGYEGLATDGNYFYLGLEGFTKNYQFADSSVIFVAKKSDRTIIKEISTKCLRIHTVCGLFSDKDYSLWGIDRNQRKIFNIKFDENLNVINSFLFDCSTRIPGYPELNYNPSLESITMDDDNNLYLIDDPWKEAFIPDQNILDKLDSTTVKNFKELVPIIFKYKINYN